MKLNKWAMQVWNKWDVLLILVLLVQFSKSEKHPWRSVAFTKVAGFFATLLKVALLHGSFSRFLNSANGTKSRKASRIVFLQKPLKTTEKLRKRVNVKLGWYCARNESAK